MQAGASLLAAGGMGDGGAAGEVGEHAAAAVDAEGGSGAGAAQQDWTMDQAIAHVGGWGEHQKWTCLYCGVPWLIAGMFAFGPVLYSKEMMQENEWGGCREEQMANSIYFAANFVGNAVFGPIADAVGRRRGVIASLATTALGGMLSITAQSWPHYLAARALVGLGNSGVCLVSSVLISEVVSADVRSLVVCFYLQVFFAVGIMLGIPTDHVTSTYRTAIAVPTCLSILWFNVLVLDLVRCLCVRCQCVSDDFVSDARVSDAFVSDACVSDASVSDAFVSDALMSDVRVSDAFVSDDFM